MSDLSPILSLPLLAAAQAQKHVTHNEALMRLDLLVHLTVADRTLTTPPGSPVEGQRHIVASGATGAWSGKVDSIALWQDAAWQFITPLVGFQAWVAGEGAAVTFDGTTWVAAGTATVPAVLSVDRIGVSASSDATNRIAVSSGASLFNHAGSGHQMKLNKAAAAHSASLLFQSDFSGRAEMGLLGDNDFSLNVSIDGSSFTPAFRVNAATAQIGLSHPLLLVGQAAAPVSPADGLLWHDSSRGQLMARIAGQSRVIDEQASLPCLVPAAAEYVQTTMGSGGATSVLAGAANRVELFPFVPGADLVIDAVGVNCTTAVAAAQCKVIVYEALANGRPGDRIFETATADLSSTGNKVLTASLTLRRGRTYWLGVRHSATASLSAWTAQATPDIAGGTTMLTTARKTLRRTITFADAAPTSWGFVSSEINAGVAPAIWLRMA